jgi:hypothetical protein
MNDFETWSLIVMTAQAAALVPTLAFGAYQITLQNKEIRRQRQTLAYEVYQRISSANADLLWKAAEDPSLDAIWEPADPVRAATLDAAQRQVRWGAWYAMTDAEQKAYRYTRSALELAEQAWHVHELGLIDGTAWAKWRTWGSVWKTSRYYTYVVDDECERLLPGFVDFLRASPPLADDRAGHVSEDRCD